VTMDVDAYLRRIGYSGPLVASAETLHALHRQHLFTVPFENLNIPLKTAITLELPLLYDKIVTRRRGGFCYELNGLFAELLLALGFRVQMLSARVHREDDSFGPEFDHMLLKVDLDGPWLADVGFGDSFVNPIRFPRGSDEVQGKRYFLLSAGEDWLLVREDETGQTPQYRFRDVPRQFADYAPMCHYHQTSPESGFTRRWICSRATPEGRITLANRRLIMTRNGQREERLLTTEEEARHCLREQFGVELDDADLSPLMRDPETTSSP